MIEGMKMVGTAGLLYTVRRSVMSCASRASIIVQLSRVRAELACVRCACGRRAVEHGHASTRRALHVHRLELVAHDGPRVVIPACVPGGHEAARGVDDEKLAAHAAPAHRRGRWQVRSTRLRPRHREPIRRRRSHRRRRAMRRARADPSAPGIRPRDARRSRWMRARCGLWSVCDRSWS